MRLALKLLRAVQEAAKKTGADLAITLSDPGIVENFKSEFEILMRNGIDLVFCNLREAKLLTRQNNLESCKKKMKEKSCLALLLL